MIIMKLPDTSSPVYEEPLRGLDDITMMLKSFNLLEEIRIRMCSLFKLLFIWTDAEWFLCKSGEEKRRSFKN